MTADIREEATATVTDELAPRYCNHVGRCVCRPRVRGTSWLVIDALISAGWTLTPPPADPTPCPNCAAPTWDGLHRNGHRVCVMSEVPGV